MDSLYITVAMGVFSLSIALFCAYKFYKLRHLPMHRALFYMLIAESVACTVTFIFALSTLGSQNPSLETLNSFSDFILSTQGSTLLRWILFSSMSLSSLYLILNVNTDTE